MSTKIVKSALLCIFITVFLMLSVSCDKDTDTGTSTGTDTETTTGTGGEDDEAGVVRLINVDYNKMTYVGVSLRDFSRLFDEQSSSGNPLTNNPLFPSSIVPPYDADNDGDIDDDDLNMIYEVTTDLECIHYIECIYVYFSKENRSLTVEAGTPFGYEFSKDISSARNSWIKIELQGDYRYINLKFPNGQAPNEVLIYGYEKGERDYVNTAPHENKPFSYFLGINGNRADLPSQLECANYFRDYFTWTWAYDTTRYPKAGTTFLGSNSSSYDMFYKLLTASYEVSPVPCLMYTNESPALEGSDKYSPASYVMYGEFTYQLAVRYGNNPNNTTAKVFLLSGGKRVNYNTIKWVEAGNEPNGEWGDGFTPYQLAALTSCAYDGHNSTVTAPDGSGVGIKNADPNLKMAMAGLAGIPTKYIKSMVFWLKNNRSDGSVGIDAFNVHTYCKKQIEYNGYSVYTGVCPEIGNIVSDELKELVDYRNKYYPDIEIWLTEFGWDTNQSYETENAAHAYGEYTGRQVQAMWLVRAYFMFAAAGVDRAAMYMCKDLGPEETTVGKYGTSGVIASDGTYKDSFYYIFTLKNTMNDMYFAEIIDSGNEDVWIYRFENGSGKSCYAVWCPTMDSIKYDNFNIEIDADSATLVEFKYGETSGVSSELTVSSDRSVKVNVSECPVLIFAD